MPGARELAEAQARIQRMTDAELVDLDAHPADYEPWALELGRAELARRGLPAAHVEELRQQNATEAAREEAARNLGRGWLYLKLAGLALALVVVVAKVVPGFRKGADDARLSETCASILAQAADATSTGDTVKLGAHSLSTAITCPRCSPAASASARRAKKRSATPSRPGSRGSAARSRTP